MFFVRKGSCWNRLICEKQRCGIGAIYSIKVEKDSTTKSQGSGQGKWEGNMMDGRGERAGVGRWGRMEKRGQDEGEGRKGREGKEKILLRAHHSEKGVGREMPVPPVHPSIMDNPIRRVTNATVHRDVREIFCYMLNLQLSFSKCI